MARSKKNRYVKRTLRKKNKKEVKVKNVVQIKSDVIKEQSKRKKLIFRSVEVLSL